MSLAESFRNAISGPHHRLLQKRTVRFRLTLLYGALFLASGLGLLILTNVLVRQATGDFVAFARSDATSSPGGDDSLPVRVVIPGDREVPVETVRLLEAQAEEHRQSLAEQRAEERRQLLIQSGVALGIMSFVSIGLGWIVAGRVLRPLRTITDSARSITATNLHKRLALSGPDDEIKEVGNTIDDLLDRLERAFDAQRQFVANASHELRTPLARQRTLIEVALGDPEPSVESLRHAHERVLASEQQQERLIEALLTLARSERGIEGREPLDLDGIVGQALDAAQPEIDRRQIRLDAQLGNAVTLGDRALIERLVTNLIDNAWRYNSPQGTLTMATGARQGKVFLSVSNSGSQVSPGEVDGLFEPFRRLGQDRVRQDDGHGLGLSIVSAIAAAHDARVSAAANRDGGLTIEVEFPTRLPH